MNPFSIDPQLIPHPHSIEKMNKKEKKSCSRRPEQPALLECARPHSQIKNNTQKIQGKSKAKGMVAGLVSDYSLNGCNEPENLLLYALVTFPWCL